MERSQEDAVKASNTTGRSQVYASENVLLLNLLTGALLLIIESRTPRTISIWLIIQPLNVSNYNYTLFLCVNKKSN